MLIWSRLHRIALPFWYFAHPGYTVEDIAKDIVKANVALTKKDQGLENCRTFCTCLIIFAHLILTWNHVKSSDRSSEYIRSHQNNPRNWYHLNIPEHTWTLSPVGGGGKGASAPPSIASGALHARKTTNSTNFVDTVPPNLITSGPEAQTAAAMSAKRWVGKGMGPFPRHAFSCWMTQRKRDWEHPKVCLGLT